MKIFLLCAKVGNLSEHLHDYLLFCIILRHPTFSRYNAEIFLKLIGTKIFLIL